MAYYCGKTNSLRFKGKQRKKDKVEESRVTYGRSHEKPVIVRSIQSKCQSQNLNTMRWGAHAISDNTNLRLLSELEARIRASGDRKALQSLAALINGNHENQAACRKLWNRVKVTAYQVDAGLLAERLEHLFV